MQKLKRVFYYFLGAIILVALLSMVVIGLVDSSYFLFTKRITSSSVLFILLIFISILLGQINKKELTKLREFADAEGLFERYTEYYKRRLFLNYIPVVITAILYILANKNIFFYILLVQIFLSFIFFPRKSQILRELPGSDITFDYENSPD